MVKGEEDPMEQKCKVCGEEAAVHVEYLPGGEMATGSYCGACAWLCLYDWPAIEFVLSIVGLQKLIEKGA